MSFPSLDPSFPHRLFACKVLQCLSQYPIYREKQKKNKKKNNSKHKIHQVLFIFISEKGIFRCIVYKINSI